MNAETEAFKLETGLFPIAKLGDIIQGVILEKNSKIMLVDLGKFGTGAVYKNELLNARHLLADLKPGDPISAKILDPDNEDGYVELSLAAADKQKAWVAIVDLKEKDEPLTLKIRAFNKGGLIADLNGLSAFLPTSQLSNDHLKAIMNEDKTVSVEAMQTLIGKEITVKILDVNPRNNKLIISEREASEVNMKELAKNYQVGQTIEGVVSGITDFGVFLKFTDNPEVEGLAHVSELSHRLVSNPKEIVNVDEVLKAKIIEINDGKISLSLKALSENPWDNLAVKYAPETETKGLVYNLNPFGAIITLDGEIQGQVHVSEFGSVEEMKKTLVLGKEYEFLIASVSPADKRIVLKMKK